MTTIEFLSQLREIGVQLWVDGERLRYSAPPNAISPALRAELAARKAELFSVLRTLQANAAPQLPPLQPAARTDSAPLSFAQQRAWFIDQLAPGNPAYNIPLVVRLTGHIDAAIFARSYAEIVRRHEILRTTFPLVAGQPVQLIAEPHSLRVPIVDLRCIPADRQAAAARRIIMADISRSADLSRGPLLWTTVLAMSATEHIFVLTLHHIIADTWSLGIFSRELATLYHAFVANTPSPLPALPVQYADYAIWQRQALQGELLDRQLAYWRTQLADAPTLNLATDYPRPSGQTFDGARRTFALSSPLSDALRQLGEAERATLFMTLLASFQILLARYTRQSDIVVGSSIANRTHSAIEGLIGYFVNTLALRSDLAGQPSFRTLLERVRAVTMAAYAHQDVPFEKLVEELQPARDLSRQPFFQVMFELQNAPMPTLHYPDVTLEALELERVTAAFDLTLNLVQRPTGLSGFFEYNTNLFAHATIARMQQHFATLLASIVANPDQQIAELPWLTAAERHQLLVAWNSTAVAYPHDYVLAQLFEAQAAHTPDAVAAVCGDERLTYAELNRRANRLAHLLVEHGVGASVLVALLSERGPAFLIAMLAVFKAGGAYLPLDTQHPPGRINQVLGQSAVPLVLTARSFAPTLHTAITQLPADARPQTLLLQDALHADRPIHNLPLRCTPGDLAYVIYTSGSTGTPKGAMIEQRGMINHLFAKIQTLALTTADIVVQNARQSFDISVWQSLAALLVGGHVQIYSDDIAHDPAALVRQTAQDRASILELVPSMLAAILHEFEQHTLAPPDLRDLRWLIPNGEVLPPKLCRDWLAAYPAIPLINAYGPTECSDDVSQYVLDTPQAAAVARIAIGRPLGNTRIYILDAQLQPVPIGVPGELYVGGIGVGRGYFNDPQKTAEKYIPDPFAALTPAAAAAPPLPRTGEGAGGEGRLYKTDDLAYYLPDGNIGFVGRVDHQIKLRGFRIELGEIEAVLTTHPSVRAAAVVLREDTPGDQRLVAYAVMTKDERRTTNDEEHDPSFVLRPSSFVPDLRAFLATRLPDYMIPAAFVLLDALPLTPHGKLDRRALPPPTWGEYAQDSGFVAPHTPTQELLAGIWAEVLGVDHVGINDNFFQMGGHSLLATRVLSRMRNAFQVELPLHILFDEPTVGAIAERIAAAQLALPALPTLPIQPAPPDAAIPLSYAQQELWNNYRRAPDTSAYTEIAATRLSGELHVAALEQTINEIVRRHQTLRTTFRVVGGQPVQVVAPTAAIAMPIVDLCGLPADEWQRAAQQHAQMELQQPFDLANGPLLRATLLRMSATEHVLLLANHRIAFDRWSSAILMREAAILYNAFAGAQPAPLPEPPINYSDYSVWQRQWLQGERLASLLAYWRHTLADLPPLALLPTDATPAVRSFRGARYPLAFPPPLVAALRSLSRREDVTVFMTLVAAFKIVLYAATGQTDLRLGIGIANRTRSEIEGLIGSFANTLVLRSDLSGDPGFPALLRRVRATTLAAYAHQELPFELLTEALQGQATQADQPLFQVMLIFQNMPADAPALPGLTLTNLPIARATTRYELVISLEDSEQAISGSIGYSSDRFTEPTIARLAHRFQRLLEQIVADPDQTLSALAEHA